ncbi:MAG: hypothetical protein BZ137_06110 [Methanosphaera sp. rholeuAM130]|nr:DUF2207 domain-containing protein [Methanosphaera sp.]RAP53711.1 MAG: hypothetical protein BZ137_06110 [Methanosphaera sp. rholeuAM130]
MNNSIKRIIPLLLIILLLIIPFAYSSDGQYSLDKVNKDIVIKDDATCIITEDIAYDIHDNVNGVYRSIILSGGQSVDNISVETPGFYNRLEVINNTNNVTLKVWLYSDEAKTKQVNPGVVRVIYHYNFNKGVKIYNDIAEFQYSSWDKYWDSGVSDLTESIHIPGSSQNVEYWNNPSRSVNESTWTSDDTLSIKFNKLESGQQAEQRILMPKDYFKSSKNADVIQKDAKSQIESDQSFYALKESIADNFGYIAALISTILMAIPLGIYFKYARNGKSMYYNQEESQIPTDDKPLLVNMLLNGQVGEVNADGYNATLLDLIEERYFKLVHSDQTDTIIQPTNRDLSNLRRYELDVYDYVSSFADEKNHISFKNMLADSRAFSRFMNAWVIDTSHEFSSLDIRRYYDDRASTYTVYTSYASFVIAIILLFLAIFVFSGGLTNLIAIVFAGLLLVVSVVLFIMPNNIMGCWTSMGSVFHDRWTNFKKYLLDYSLIRERPPASIQVWGKYLVYATALGCADEVRKNMLRHFSDTNVSQEMLYDMSVVYLAGNYGFNNMFFYSVPTHIDTSDIGGSFGDIGGPGSGGFGGGGGGVF